MPAVSQAQRGFLFHKFGKKWCKKHHFNNKGELPAHHEKDEKKKKDESMDTARARVMALVLRYEKSQGKELTEEEEKFLAEDTTSVNIGTGPATGKAAPRKTGAAFQYFLSKKRKKIKKREFNRPDTGKYPPSNL
jgi:hypothetical protein